MLGLDGGHDHRELPFIDRKFLNNTDPGLEEKEIPCQLTWNDKLIQ